MNNECILKNRAGEPANFLAAPAPAPDFFKTARLLIFVPSGSGPCSWYFFSSGSGSTPRGQKHPAPTGFGSDSLAKYSFLRKLVG